MTTVSSSSSSRPPLFSRWSVIGLVIFTIVGFFASQLLGLYIAAKIVLPPDDGRGVAGLIEQGGMNGSVVSLSVIMSFIFLTLMTFLIIARKVPNSRRLAAYLGLRGFTPTIAFQGVLLLLVFTIGNELLSQWFNRTPMDFIDPLFASMESKWLLVIVVVLIAPLYEELLFRGLLWAAIAEQFAPRQGTVVASVVTSILFAMIHLQYQLFEMVSIFILALIFCYVRVKSNSTLLTMLLHIINNGAAMILYLMMGSGAL
ncbi:CPBP family intramembrane glutamic endopeptidase [Psychrobacter pygoscelis]|uniref:CPBP family intramembrane glutamic endopeptidase n=1 Tax=Psychrobacter pygoscelis TaxID=2488563 RepID=UPI0010386EAC|nr:CPBP family intramembrane glutamic endopeptidase [Psychrobacter pygoscelis]